MRSAGSRRPRWPLVLFLIVVMPLAGLFGLAAAALDRQPRVPAPPAVSPQDIGRVYALLKRHGPGNAPPGAMRSVQLGARDLELLISEGARRFDENLRPAVHLHDGRADVEVSLPVPAQPLGGWLNLRARLLPAAGLPELESLHVGAVRVPRWLLLWGASRVIRSHRLEAQAALALQAVRQVSFKPDGAWIAFAWPRQDLRQTMADTLLTPEEQARVRVYVQRVAALVSAPRLKGAPTGVLPLAEVLPPLFRLAQQRSAQAPEGTAAEENRAALLALTLMANPGALHKLLPAARRWAPMRPLRLTLRGRPDFPLHFMVSAVLAAEAGGPLADAVGIYKELADTRGGTGFSFNDIAADRAGTRFGLLARHSPEVLQQRLAQGLTDEALLPPVADLPESLTAAEFQQRFGGVDTPAYRALQAEIERRLDALPLLAGAPASSPAR